MRKAAYSTYPELERQIAVRHINVKDMYNALGITGQSLREKRLGMTQFRLDEAVALHRMFFHDVDFLTLFRREILASWAKKEKGE